MSSILIGCPVSRREWIIDRWFDHVEEACARAGLSPTYIFVGDPTSDAETFDIIKARAPEALIGVVVDGRPTDRRQWNWRRYARMAELRNLLLSGVRREAPQAFLSLDSDILLHPDSLPPMLAQLDSFGGSYGAVGGKCYLSKTGTKAPSWGKLSRSNKLQRQEASGIMRVDVLMAIKLMGPRAYAVDYQPDTEGEDIGWSKACREAGVALGWVGTVVSKHVMDPSLLDVIDPRVGW